MTLASEVRALLADAVHAMDGSPHADTVADALTRLDAPLRVAIAGKVKAGKSTLLNALVGERVAATDEGECTQIITWYRHGLTYRASAQMRSGGNQQVAMRRLDDGQVNLDLGQTPALEVEHLLVDWPSSTLRDVTLVDTPGIGSLTQAAEARTVQFLAPSDQPAAADAVVYLMRHLHAMDVDFLEAFHDDGVAHPTPVNAIGVLSRADEIGAGRLDAMDSAGRIAQRYRGDRQIRQLCQTVLPVAGLLAEAGATLRDVEFRSLGAAASLPTDEADGLLLSADRFSGRASGEPAPEREALLMRLGLFGVRLAVQLVRTRAVANASQLAEELVARSGIAQLRRALHDQFTQRADLLRARSGLLVMRSVVTQDTSHTELAARVERIEAGAHELAELRLLNALRTEPEIFDETAGQEAERLLGVAGGSAIQRLGLEPGANPDEVRAASLAALARWQQRAESPLSSRMTADAARVLVRTCEGLLSGR